MCGVGGRAQVSDLVGTKLPHQCVLHFLQLPIEDPYLEQMELGQHQQGGLPGVDLPPPSASANEPPEAPWAPMSFPMAGGVADGALPFAEASNPMMAQVHARVTLHIRNVACEAYRCIFVLCVTYAFCCILRWVGV